MNVTCENCQRRYVVPDEKLGPRVRLRCKNCQHVIEVSAAPPPPPPAPAANPWEEEATRATPALDRQARWFAMVRGQQLGPLELAGLEAQVRAGEVTLATFLWREGMPEWRKAEAIPELLPVFAGPRNKVVPPPSPAPAPGLQGLFDDEERTVLRKKAPQPKTARGQAARQPEEEVNLDDSQPPFEANLFASSRGSGGWKWVLLTLVALALGGVAAIVTRPSSAAAPAPSGASAPSPRPAASGH